jgi:serine/threonine-protein kinase
VYRVFDCELRERIALKAVSAASPCAPAVAQLFAEARQGRRIRHPNVCRVHDVSIHHPPAGAGMRTYFSTMELIDGSRLASILNQGALELPVSLSLVRQMLAGLAAAHEVGIQHRKLDSHRVLVGKGGSEPKVSLIEFGLAEVTEFSSAQERSSGVATDLHDVGVVLLEMLTGNLPEARCPPASLPGASERGWLSRALGAGIPPHVADVVRRCLSPRSEEQFADARAVLEVLVG